MPTQLVYSASLHCTCAALQSLSSCRFSLCFALADEVRAESPQCTKGMIRLSEDVGMGWITRCNLALTVTISSCLLNLSVRLPGLAPTLHRFGRTRSSALSQRTMRVTRKCPCQKLHSPKHQGAASTSPRSQAHSLLNHDCLEWLLGPLRIEQHRRYHASKSVVIMSRLLK